MSAFNRGFLGGPRRFTMAPDRALLQSIVIAGQASVAFNNFLDAAFDSYEIEGINIVPVTNNVDLLLNMSVDGGGTFDSGAAAYSAARRVLGANTTDYSAASATTTNIGMAGVTNIISNVAASGGMSFIMRLFRPAAIAQVKNVVFQGSYSGPTAFAHVTGSGSGISATLQASAVNGLNFQFSSGAMASGVLRLRGIPIS